MISISLESWMMLSLSCELCQRGGSFVHRNENLCPCSGYDGWLIVLFGQIALHK